MRRKQPKRSDNALEWLIGLSSGGLVAATTGTPPLSLREAQTLSNQSNAHGVWPVVGSLVFGQIRSHSLEIQIY